MTAAAELLRSWVLRRASPEGAAWFAETLAALLHHPSDRALYFALGFAPRRLGKADLALGEEELAQAAAVRPGWDPSDWSIDQAARLAFLLARFDGDEAAFARLLETLFVTADIGELVCFYRGLPLYPGPQLLLARAREGARTSMRPVFEAVAHRNPYPAEHFDEAAWNQMILKALFIGSRLWPIQRLDERRNPELARMLLDYAHERRAAGRPVDPELWRGVGPFATGPALADLARALDSSDPLERAAAVLALSESPDPEATTLLARAPELAAAARSGRLDWAELGRQLSARERLP
ncbi:hypothetical protein HRbin40_02435 [bacterium HR40]|nr:hypothetical protein HRbin40_02435 [bacterium HR40]